MILKTPNTQVFLSMLNINGANRTKLMVSIKYILFSFLLFFTIVGNCQSNIHSDTIKMPNSDTLIVKWYKGQRITDEHIYISGKLCFKRWYYYRNKKGFYGYYTSDRRGIKPKYEEYKQIYFDGRIKEYGILNGFQHNGFRKTYYRNGNLQCDCNFKMGKRDSVNKSRYENGQLEAIINFKNGKEDGKQTWFYKNGQFKGELIFNTGKLLEIVSLFDQNGKRLEKGTLKGGTGTLNIYNDNGELEYIEYYKNGKVKKKSKPIILK